MRTTVPEGYPYPLDTDAAALGPQLQALADAGDSRYGTAQLGDFGWIPQYLRNPGIVRVNTAQQGPVGFGGILLLGFPTVLFDTTGNPGTTNMIVLPGMPDGRTLCTFYVGASITASTTGSTSADTARRLTMTIVTTDPFTGVQTTKILYTQEVDPGATNTGLIIGTYLRAAQGSVTWTFDHANSASSMVVVAQATAYAARISPQPNV